MSTMSTEPDIFDIFDIFVELDFQKGDRFRYVARFEELPDPSWPCRAIYRIYDWSGREEHERAYRGRPGEEKDRAEGRGMSEAGWLALRRTRNLRRGRVLGRRVRVGSCLLFPPPTSRTFPPGFVREHFTFSD